MSADQVTDPDQLASDLSDVLTALEVAPDNVSLLQRQIDIMRTLGMADEVLDTIARLSTLVMLDEDQWLTVYDAMDTHPLTLDAFEQFLDRNVQLMEDYLSIKVLKRHIQSIVNFTTRTDIDPEINAALTPETLREMLRSASTRGAGELGSSSEIWTVWRDWEMTQLQNDDNRATQLERLHTLYLDRLAVPHTDFENTASAYSSFCTEFCTSEYEARMVTATSTLQGAKAKLAEKRHGQTRQDYEDQLSYAQDVGSRVPILVSYVAWETDPQAKRGGSRGPIIDPMLTQGVFERTVSAYSLMATGASSSDGTILKEGEATIWERYVNWARANCDDQLTMTVANRATRACPQSSRTWCALLNEMERQQMSPDDITATFERALVLGAVLEGQLQHIADLFLARAAQLGRLHVQDLSQGDAHPVIAIIGQGLERIVKVDKDGDPSLKLEKFLLEWVESKAPDRVEEALELLKKPLRVQSCSYQMVLQRATLELRRGQADAARQIYLAAIQRSDLDWPEAVYEALSRFETVHGSIETTLQSARKIEKESEKLARRREKVAREQAAYQYTETQVMSEIAEAEPVAEEVTTSVVAAPATDTETSIKRDREHTTVLVGGLPKGTSQALLESFFESCGDIRETTITGEEGWPTDIALLEFRAVEAVALALAKDRRKFDGHEITVTMLWRSTLFVTNFPREMDESAIKSLFQNYGTVLSSRWPSRKYADSRRFCYITMGSPAAAENALALDGYRSDPNARFGLTVRISDPSAKVKRTDESDAVLFIGGLTSKTKEQEVRELVENKGVIRSLKLGWDPVKAICKGFAFVTMASEADAKEALTLHGTSYRGRKLKVERNDPNFANKKTGSDVAIKEKRARTVRLHDVPTGMQEGLLQQALEKIVPVRRLELFTKTHHAQAELENQADVGKLLLRREPFEVDGSIIKITDPNQRPTEQKTVPASSADNDVKTTNVLAFAPRAAKKGGTLGRGRHGAPVQSTSSQVTAGASQDAFRAVVEAKNKQREGNLESKREKRSLEQESDHEKKKAKVE